MGRIAWRLILMALEETAIPEPMLSISKVSYCLATPRHTITELKVVSPRSRPQESEK
jgi:hypothetical protein